MRPVPVDLPPPVNHVFVDCENVPKIESQYIGMRGFDFTLLLGSQQKKLDAVVVEALLNHAASVHLVRLTSKGRNALDFSLAFYLGQAVAADPSGIFYIISEDKGYDPLIEHLRLRHIDVRRLPDFANLIPRGEREPSTPAPAPLSPKPLAKLDTPLPERKPRPHSAISGPAGKAQAQFKLEAQPSVVGELNGLAKRAWNNLTGLSISRPKTLKRLTSHLVACFRNDIDAAGASKLIETLHQAGYLRVGANGSVTYLEQQV